jgi:hypothetical protein
LHGRNVGIVDGRKLQITVVKWPLGANVLAKFPKNLSLDSEFISGNREMTKSSIMT